MFMRCVSELVIESREVSDARESISKHLFGSVTGIKQIKYGVFHDCCLGNSFVLAF